MEENKKETKPVEKKKTEEKKVKVKETSKNNKIIIGVVISAIVVIAIITSMLLMKKSPKKVVEQAFSELKAGSFEQKMLSGLVQGEEGLNAEAQKLLFEKLEWKVLKETQEGEMATVEVEITNKDFKTIMEKLIQKTQQAVKSALTGNISEDTITNWLLEELRNEEAEMTTTNAKVTLKKEENEWKIENEEDFYYVTLPGFQEAMNAIQ